MSAQQSSKLGEKTGDRSSTSGAVPIGTKGAANLKAGIDASAPHGVGAESLSLSVPAELIEAVAARAAEIVLERLSGDAGASPWLSPDEAAERLRCPRKRVYELVAQGALKPRRDGRRVLLHRRELDAYIEGGA